VIKKEGKTYKDEGHFLEDYYAFGKDVISPINGYIIAIKSDLPDNFIGNVDRLNNWGKMGQIIAKCGNSGYSPEPHIHIQVQKYAVLGSETIPFTFIDYIENGKLYY